jgi:hypothetical protein
MARGRNLKELAQGIRTVTAMLLIIGTIPAEISLSEAGQADDAAAPAVQASTPANIDTIHENGVYPTVTQSQSTISTSDGKTVVVVYNDSKNAPNSYSGMSVSTDSGGTFARLNPSPFASGHGTDVGEPFVVYNAKLQKWFAGNIAGNCRDANGGYGIGVWSSSDASNWSAGTCAHKGFQCFPYSCSDERPTSWVDNTPGSPYYGRIYISFNAFNVALNSWLVLVYSDDGATWSTITLVGGTNSSNVIRNMRIVSGPDGAVFVIGMNEGGGAFNNRQNFIYRSTNGGASWSSAIKMGGAFAPPGDSVCSDDSYYVKISPIWRYMGWGQPGVGANTVVHYVYGGKGGNANDTGDIYYIRSTDNGNTWSTPIILNTDQAAGGTKSQWMPSLSVASGSDINVYWYDRRNSTDGQNYEIWHRQSSDNGSTWHADEVVSSQLIPQPEQPDSSFSPCYGGDYNHALAYGNTHYMSWTDGRVQVSGHNQQDVFFAKVPSSPGPYILSVSVIGSPGGKLTSSPSGIDCGSSCSASFGAGTTVTLTATPALAWGLSSWGGSCGGLATSCTVTLNANTSVSAIFTTRFTPVEAPVVTSPTDTSAPLPAVISSVPH